MEAAECWSVHTQRRDACGPRKAREKRKERGRLSSRGQASRAQVRERVKLVRQQTPCVELPSHFPHKR